MDMDQAGISILMFLFAGAIFIYAILMMVTKDYSILPWRSTISVKPKNKKKYTYELGKVMAVVAIAPALAGLVALWNAALSIPVLIIGVIIAIWIGTKMMKSVQ